MLTPISLIAPPPKLSPADKESTMVIDIYALGAHVEMLAAGYLQPYPEGMYIRNQASPVLWVGETYHQKNSLTRGPDFTLTDPHAFAKLSPKDGAIYDSRDQLVVQQYCVSVLTAFPEVPVKGMAIVEGFIKKIVNTNGHWPHGQVIETTEDLLQADFLPQWMSDPMDAALLAAAEDPKTADKVDPAAKQRAETKRLILDRLIDNIESALYEMRNQLIEFIGKDKWMMHFVKKSKDSSHDILIEKTINYKVYDWDRRMASGIWHLNDEVPEEPIVDEKTKIYQQTLADIASDRQKFASQFGRIDMILAANRR